MFEHEPFAPDDDYYGEHTLRAKSLLDGREVHLLQYMFNLRLAVTTEPHGMCYEDGYCFHDSAAAYRAFESWDGDSIPSEPWAKNPFRGVYGPCSCVSCQGHQR